MSRWRKIDVRMWGDEKFRSLSAPPPNGQFLFVYLLTGKETTSLPGIFEAREVALADRLGWTLEDFREAFGEVSAKGMAKADWKAGLVWVPNAFKYAQPESPNVVKSWAAVWDELPECALKYEAFRAFLAFIKGLPEAFRKAFKEALPEDFANQEQEQEQENTLSPEGSPGQQALASVDIGPKKINGVRVGIGVKRKPNADEANLWQFWKVAMRKSDAHVIDQKRLAAMHRALSNHTLTEMKKAVIGCRSSPFHQGENDRATKYNDIEIICRDEKHFSDFIRLYRPGDEKEYGENFTDTNA